MKEIFANPDIGLFGLLFFFCFFCAAVIWTFRPGAKAEYDRHARIPLHDQNEEQK